MKFIIFLTSLLVSISVFSRTHKVAVDAATYTHEVNGVRLASNITKKIAEEVKSIFDDDTSDANGGGSWSVHLTRPTDADPGLAARIEAANSFGAERLIRVLLNSYSSASATGTETFARLANNNEKDLATKVQDQVVPLLGLNDRGVKGYAGYADANMEVIKLFSGFWTNLSDRALLNSDTGSKNVAKGILFGTQEHFGLTAFEPNTIVDTTDPTITITSHTNNQVVNTESITIAGTIDDDTMVESAKINNETIVLNGDEFSKEITLTEGLNTITIFAVDFAGNDTTKVININYVIIDTIAPNIIIVSPSYNAVVNTQNLQIRGKVTDNDSGVKYLKIDNVEVSLNAQGVFTHDVVLTQGLNTFLLKAEDNNLNVKNSDLKVTYEIGATDTNKPVIIVNTPTENQTVNVASIQVTGSVQDESNISYFTINGDEVNLANNTFSHSVTLSEGSNQISLFARDEFNNEQTKLISVTYNSSATDTDPPIITISSPADNARLSNPSVTILGSVSDISGVKDLTINSAVVTLDGNNFSYNVTLVIGENKFELKSKDIYDNETTKYLTLFLESHTNSGPEIIITSPRNGDTVYQDTVNIKGTVRDSDGIKYIYINNSKLKDATASNEFSHLFILNEGINKIRVKAVDNLDNESERVIEIEYKIKESKEEGCNFDKNTNKNFTNTFIFLIIGFVLYFRRRWTIKNKI